MPPDTRLGPDKVRALEAEMSNGKTLQQIADLHGLGIRLVASTAEALGFRMRNDGTFVRPSMTAPIGLTPPRPTEALRKMEEARDTKKVFEVAAPEPPEPGIGRITLEETAQPEGPLPPKATHIIEEILATNAESQVVPVSKMPIQELVALARTIDDPKVESALNAYLSARGGLIRAVESFQSRSELEDERKRLREEREAINARLKEIEGTIGRPKAPPVDNALVPGSKRPPVAESVIRDRAVEVGRLTPEQRRRPGRVSASMKRAYYEANPS